MIKVRVIKNAADFARTQKATEKQDAEIAYLEYLEKGGVSLDTLKSELGLDE